MTKDSYHHRRLFLFNNMTFHQTRSTVTKNDINSILDLMANWTAHIPPNVSIPYLAFDVTVIVAAACCLILTPILCSGYTRLVFTTRALLLSLKSIVTLGFVLGWYGKVINEPVSVKAPTIPETGLNNVPEETRGYVIVSRHVPPGYESARLFTNFCQGMDECLRVIFVHELFMCVHKMRVRTKTAVKFAQKLGVATVIVSIISGSQILMEKIFEAVVVNVRSTAANRAKPFQLFLTTIVTAAYIYMGVKIMISLVKSDQFRRENGLPVDGKNKNIFALLLILISCQLLHFAKQVFMSSWLSFLKKRVCEQKDPLQFTWQYNQSFDHSFFMSLDYEMHQSLDPSLNQPIIISQNLTLHLSLNQSLDLLLDQSSDLSLNRSFDSSTYRPLSQSLDLPLDYSYYRPSPPLSPLSPLSQSQSPPTPLLQPLSALSLSTTLPPLPPLLSFNITRYHPLHGESWEHSLNQSFSQPVIDPAIDNQITHDGFKDREVQIQEISLYLEMSDVWLIEFLFVLSRAIRAKIFHR